MVKKVDAEFEAARPKTISTRERRATAWEQLASEERAASAALAMV